ncbi:hypothetical protein M8J77_017268 [Diaphorina citri]|nr:hypothetical protein M8J77_017268 [Diaphorina citri]
MFGSLFVLHKLHGGKSTLTHIRTPEHGSNLQSKRPEIPHIVYITKEKLLENLTDLRFASIDYLDTFFPTYRAFTNGVTVLEVLRKAFYNAEPPYSDQDQEDPQYHHHHPGSGPGGE